MLPVGSVVLSVSANGESLSAPVPSTFSDFVTTHAPSDLQVTYEYQNEIKEVTLSPQAGLVANEPEKYIVGTSLSLVETVQKPIHLAIKEGFLMTVQGFVGISVGLVNLLTDAVAGEADFSNIAGPVGIVGLVGDAAAFGVVSLLTFTAIISLNLAVINLLPFPALDGGRLVFVLIEAVTGKEVPAAWTGWINLLGFVILMLLMVVVTYGDIMRLL